MAALRVAFLLAAVFLLRLSEAASLSSSETESALVNDGSINLGEFLLHAQVDGLITEKTSNQLLLLAANLTNSEFPSQLSILQKSDQGKRDGLSEDENDDVYISAKTSKNFFMKFYSHLTLLNVLYFGGTLLVMGAYTLFMTLAYENCSYIGLSGIMLAQVAVFGTAGIMTWQNYEEFQFVGGL